MLLRIKSVVCVLLIGMLLLPVATLEAQDGGQAKLDEATSLKLNASSPADLGKVVELCEAAIAAGLDEGSQRLAKQLIAASSFQRAQLMIQSLPGVANNPNAVRQLRRKTLDELKKAVENNPSLAEAFILMAKLEALPGGDRSQALDSLNRAIEVLKDKPVDLSAAYIMRAQLQEGNNERIEDLRKAVKADSTNIDAWQALIAMQLQLERYQEALDDAKGLLAKDESNQMALVAAVEALIRLQKRKDAIELLNVRIEKNPEVGMYYRIRAAAYREESFADGVSEADRDAANKQALEDLNKAIEVDPRDAEALVMRGMLYYQLDEVEKANRDITDSLLIRPDSVRGVWMRSMVAAQEGRYADAIADMEMLVRADPSKLDWIRQLASYYQMDKRPRLAIQLLDQLLEADPGNGPALRLRGDAKLSVNMHQEAVDDYEAAIKAMEDKRGETDPEEFKQDYSGLLNNLSWVLATSPKDELRNGARALELGLKACEATDYKAPHILSTLAAAYAETGDFENARKWASKAVELGKEQEHEQTEQLEKELESYKEDKPWREKQETEENEKPLVAPSDTIDT